MIKIHGPTYRYQGEILTQPAMIYVEDHHYSELDQCFHVKQLIDNSLCDPHSHLVVFDHVMQHNEFVSNPVYFPALLARETQEYVDQKITPDWNHKTHAFNFIINKYRVHRKILLELIDQYQLGNYCHSLCWRESPVPSVPVTDYRLGEEIVLDQGFRNRQYTNAVIYKNLLQKSVVEPTAVSLITEPAYYERETIVTEKTLVAIWGGTVPIWVGGWCIPNYMRSLGFDVFDDIVDHSYQSLQDPQDRCHRAVLNNIDLLRNSVTVDHARLQHNLDLLRANPWLAQVNSLIETYPDLRRVWPT